MSHYISERSLVGILRLITQQCNDFTFDSTEIFVSLYRIDFIDFRSSTNCVLDKITLRLPDSTSKQIIYPRFICALFMELRLRTTTMEYQNDPDEISLILYGILTNNKLKNCKIETLKPIMWLTLKNLTGYFESCWLAQTPSTPFKSHRTCHNFTIVVVVEVFDSVVIYNPQSSILDVWVQSVVAVDFVCCCTLDLQWAPKKKFLWRHIDYNTYWN